MRISFALCIFLCVQLSAQPFSGNQTPTYETLIASYEALAANYPKAALFEMGTTDAGRPLHLFVFSETGIRDMDDLKKQVKEQTVLFINNGIHAGESCGIDASLLFAKDLLQQGKIPPKVVVAIIPVYNVGGMLNRNVYSRANQLGPEEHGFRGNAQNLDLNRDFIKADALNTRSFYSIFHLLKPHIFVDTHTSNGADYQYTMTLISTQKDKLNPVLSAYLQESLEPALYADMERKNWKMTPYVNVFGSTPNDGMAAFLETPRYASGYTALFNTIGFITETHMLKPYADRVNATYAFLHSISTYASRESATLMALKQRAEHYDKAQQQFAVDWRLDSTAVKKRAFEGYAFSYEPSAVHGQKRLKYHRNAPETFTINYYDSYTPTQVAAVPEYYVVPAAFRKVSMLLQWNGVRMKPLLNDTLIEVESWYVQDAQFATQPYEGHFPLRSLKVETRRQKRRFYKGDWLVYTDQESKRFIVNVLDPMGVDAYLRWNFFDAIFQQKEWFSAYVFEETAEKLLQQDTALKAAYASWQETHVQASAFEHLYFIYRNSPYYEPEHQRYPVARSFED
jgi:hypothetical protein